MNDQVAAGLAAGRRMRQERRFVASERMYLALLHPPGNVDALSRTGVV
jgi:hypothetical protein